LEHAVAARTCWIEGKAERRCVMAGLDEETIATLEELVVLTLAMVDTVTKILIQKRMISETEFGAKLLEERTMYQKLFNSTLQ
jgi:hypothetical protein